MKEFKDELSSWDEEEKDVLAVRIKHHGQCQFERGHIKEVRFSAFWAGMVCAAFISIAISAISHITK